MRYLQKTSLNELKDKYDKVIGWGNAPLELARRFTASEIDIKYIINGEKKGIGEVICGSEIVGPETFLEFEGSICFIIFTNLESLVLKQINQMYPNADTIVSRLVMVDGAYREHSYSRDMEDIILLDLVKKLDFPQNFPYMDIGVCHPVVRNNTYMFYEMGYTNGVLVEPNPEMMDLALEYRPLNKRINGGAGAIDGVLPYIRNRNGSAAGLNHFKAADEIVDTERFIIDELPVYNINYILNCMCEEIPWVIDIDCEQMDYDIINSIDFNQKSIKILCVERDKKKMMYSLLSQKGFVHYADTLENLIFVRRDILELL